VQFSRQVPVFRRVLLSSYLRIGTRFLGNAGNFVRNYFCPRIPYSRTHVCQVIDREVQTPYIRQYYDYDSSETDLKSDGGAIGNSCE
jgi:hypothetical protein